MYLVHLRSSIGVDTMASDLVEFRRCCVGNIRCQYGTANTTSDHTDHTALTVDDNGARVSFLREGLGLGIAAIVVVDGKGRVFGMIIGGVGYTTSSDVTYVTPVEFLFNQIRSHRINPNINFSLKAACVDISV